MNGQTNKSTKSTSAKRRSPLSSVIGDVGESESAMNIDDRIPNSNGTSLNGDPPSMELTSDEVNFLVFRYLQEAGKIPLRIEKQTRSLLATKHRQLPHLSHLAPPFLFQKDLCIQHLRSSTKACFHGVTSAEQMCHRVHSLASYKKGFNTWE